MKTKHAAAIKVHILCSLVLIQVPVCVFFNLDRRKKKETYATNIYPANSHIYII